MCEMIAAVNLPVAISQTANRRGCQRGDIRTATNASYSNTSPPKATRLSGTLKPSAFAAFRQGYEVLRNTQAQCLCSLEIDREFEFRGLKHRAVNRECGLFEHFTVEAAVKRETAIFRVHPERIHSRHAVSSRQSENKLHVVCDGRMRNSNNSGARSSSERIECGFDSGTLNGRGHHPPRQVSVQPIDR